MARYTGPKAKKARALGEPIFGFSRAFEKKKYRYSFNDESRKNKLCFRLLFAPAHGDK